MTSQDRSESLIESLIERYGLPRDAGPTLLRLAQLSTAAEISSGTAVATLDAAVTTHIADSLSICDATQLVGDERSIDVGSGLGFPGLVIAVAFPGSQVTLLDSARKKVDAAARIARSVGLKNVECVWARAEELGAVGGPAREALDLVTARAVAPLSVLLEYAAPLLRDRGRLVAWKGAPAAAEIDDAQYAAGRLSMNLRPPVEVHPFDGSGARTIWIAEKSGATPDGFPRRPGQARRNPLTAPAAWRTSFAGTFDPRANPHQ